jgi:hypothetical protein
MTDIAKGEFAKLDMDGSNYLTWAIDIEIKLNGLCLNHTLLQPEAGKDKRAKPKALHFMQHHLHQDLKSGYMIESNPLVLWRSLKDRFNQQSQYKSHFTTEPEAQKPNDMPVDTKGKW